MDFRTDDYFDEFTVYRKDDIIEFPQEWQY